MWVGSTPLPHRLLALSAVQRLLGTQPLLSSSQVSAQFRDGPPPRPLRPDSLFHQEDYLMLRAARRSVILPSLSIAIPQPADNQTRAALTEGEVDDESKQHAGPETPTRNEASQKQVKFLAPGDSDNGEDAMSEQSSICQSPSWEGYGQRKREKKLEAERRKKEKERAEKEAKAAKRRNTARLSKAPPAAAETSKRDSRAVGSTNASRSISDPALITQQLGQGTQPINQPEHVGRADSAGDLQQGRRLQPAVAGVPATSKPDGTRAAQGPSPANDQSSCSSGCKPEGRSQREGCPPSASRTPLLRHPPLPNNNRSSSLFQGTVNADPSQESLSGTPAVNGGYRNGYVGYQRAQAAERAFASLADEQLIEVVDSHYPPSSSSNQTQHRRRPSLTQETKLAAMKLMGLRTSQTAKEDGSRSSKSSSQDDYLTFKAIPYSASDVESPTPAGSVTMSPDNDDFSQRKHIDEHSVTLERPPTSQSSISSSGPSTASSAPGTRNKKSRTLMGAAKSALSMPRGASKNHDSPKPTVSVPPYLALRNRMHSRASVRAASDSSHPPCETGTVAADSTVPISASNPEPSKSTETKAQEPCRASEGSSSSSAYEDGSPHPSPTITPDTSRPQSTKDAPFVVEEIRREGPNESGLQDDEDTLRLSLESSKSSTPRISNSEVNERNEMGHWSRVGLPIEVRRMESSAVSVSDLDNVDSTGWSPSSPRPIVGHLDVATPEPGISDVQEPGRPKLSFNFDSGPGDLGQTLSIPPRSKKRGGTALNHTTADTTQTSLVQESPEAQDTVRTKGEHEAGVMVGSPEGMQALDDDNSKAVSLERHSKRSQPRYQKPREPRMRPESKGSREGDETQSPTVDRATMAQTSPRSLRRGRESESISSAGSTDPSAASTLPSGSPLASEFQIPSNPYFAGLPELPMDHAIPTEALRSTGPPSPMSLPSPLQPVGSKAAPPPRTHSLPTPLSVPTMTPGASAPTSRMPGAMPVSILKQPRTSHSSASSTPELPPVAPLATPSSRPPQVLSALPKHMQQLQAGVPARSPPPQAPLPGPPGAAEGRGGAPMAKMFVECCNCRFYHDMPSKIYECMAKPDAVVEDRVLGISGAITTMVKCPWCQHNMSRSCCAGYAAVVYLKEKLH
ncbi:hypothetical protein VTK26DRAFT_1482 [Humicola hyalothermophila]